MAILSTIELRDIILKPNIGTYGPHDPVPDHHILDLTLHVAPSRIFIPRDEMEHVFDYDPLVAQIQALASDGHRETQEWLVTQVVHLCVDYTEIQKIDVYLRKFPVNEDTGTLGVRLCLEPSDLEAFGNTI